MRINKKMLTAEKIFPVAAVTTDGIVISKRGAVTIGWELTFPTAYTIDEKDYDGMVNRFESAIRTLPEWTVVHRQDIYLNERYQSEEKSKRTFLAKSYERHFDKRKYLTHRAYLFITFSSKGMIDKKGRYSGIIKGLSDSQVNVPADKFGFFLSKCKEFITILAPKNDNLITARALSKDDWLGVDGGDVGIVQRYMMLGDNTLNMSDIALSPSSVKVNGNTAISFSVGDSDKLPNEVSSIIKTNNDVDFDIYLSYASKIGLLFNREHVVNQYIIVPPQQQILQHLESEKKKMSSGLEDAENRLNSEQIQEYQDATYKDDLLTVKSHLNVIAWGPDDQKDDIIAELRAAFMSMNITSSYNLHNTPILYYAGIPSNSFELGKENMMINTLNSMLCLGTYETFEKSIPGGFLKVCDRIRNIPITLDTQLVAREKMGLIDNYNAFVLGPSGTGKSYFMNNYLKWCYENNESVFLIDVGGSYEASCHIINEESNGRDGQYLSWDMKNPPAFNPFKNYRTWINEDGNLLQDMSGANAFLSFIQTIYTPKEGWTTDNLPVIRKILSDFVKHCIDNDIQKPILNDFNEFVSNAVRKKILYKVPSVEDIKSMMIIEKIHDLRAVSDNHTVTAEDESRIRFEMDEYVLNHKDEIEARIQSCIEQNAYCLTKDRNQITSDIFDIEAFLRALSSYVDKGVFSFFLNEKDPKDIFVSRYVCFDVETLSKIADQKFYSLVILFIMNEFEQKMQVGEDFKVIVIEEAWKAIANETMSPFLMSLYKTARKYRTSAVVVTQEMQDIRSSEIIKDTIMANSSIKVLLDQKNNNCFEETVEMMRLSDRAKNMIRSIKNGSNPRNPNIKQFFIAIGNSFCGVYDGETSKIEALAFESEKVAKRPLFELSNKLGSWLGALKTLIQK